MKVSRQLARLEAIVLHPTRDLAREDWHRSPKGKWSVAQIVQHLAMGLDASSALFEKRRDRTDMHRRSKPHQAVLRHLVLSVGRMPSGFKSVEATLPVERPDPELVIAQFRMGTERFEQFHQEWPMLRQTAVFVRHPFLGDLNLPEWGRFHYVHCRHHARQIRQRLSWMRRKRK